MSVSSPCAHDLLRYPSDSELVAASRAFVADGINDGDLVIVHGGEHEVEVLGAAFHDPPVTFTPGRGRYQHVMATLGE
jgi:hypothetical protein